MTDENKDYFAKTGNCNYQSRHENIFTFYFLHFSVQTTTTTTTTTSTTTSTTTYDPIADHVNLLLQQYFSTQTPDQGLLRSLPAF